jgi:hypothetical protein
VRDERVFISSVMHDFEPQRAAVKAAVNLLGMRPVMAEDFPAKSHSSQVACLEGVALSNIMVLVLGPRYGFVAASGKSVTEEEFDEARRRGIPVLTFLQKGDREADQEAFIGRLRSYEKGYHMPSYSTPQALKDLVVQALNDHFENGDKRTLDAAGASAALGRHSWGSARPAEYSVWLGAVILPTRHEQLISIRQLGSAEFQNGILREVVYGTTAVFGPEQVERVEKEESTIFKQEGQRGPITYAATLRELGQVSEAISRMDKDVGRISDSHKGLATEDSVQSIAGESKANTRQIESLTTEIDSLKKSAQEKGERLGDMRNSITAFEFLEYFDGAVLTTGVHEEEGESYVRMLVITPETAVMYRIQMGREPDPDLLQTIRTAVKESSPQFMFVNESPLLSRTSHHAIWQEASAVLNNPTGFVDKLKWPFGSRFDLVIRNPPYNYHSWKELQTAIADKPTMFTGEKE